MIESLTIEIDLTGKAFYHSLKPDVHDPRYEIEGILKRLADAVMIVDIAKEFDLIDIGGRRVGTCRPNLKA